jgi:hypothetical protein
MMAYFIKSVLAGMAASPKGKESTSVTDMKLQAHRWSWWLQCAAGQCTLHNVY